MVYDVGERGQAHARLVVLVARFGLLPMVEVVHVDVELHTADTRRGVQVAA